MNEDAAFIRAIRERPDDETTRLVYADWLDDRSDPRAEYLRAEAAWVALQPPDEPYRPLYRRVSQLAAALDPEWFAAVSRMGHFARREWDRVAHVWEPHSKERTTEPVREWLAAKQELVTAFSRFVGPSATEQRFCVPADYLAFVTTVGGGWHQNDEWYELYSAARAARQTVGLGATFANEPDEHLEIWANVAITGDKHDFFLCCDLLSPRFGEVAEGEDYHPWMNGSAPMYSHADSFFAFLWNFSGEPSELRSREFPPTDL
jgi:uncharacterized protein (TIGR02996 family)